MKCIIIDDEATARLITRQMCKQISGLEVIEEFDNAIQAIKYLNHHEVDLILLDMNMPAFSGIDFVQTLKHNTPIICITGDRDHAIDAFEYDNIVAYLLKPIDVEKFKKAVAKARNTKKPIADKITSPQTEPPPIKEKTTDNFLYVNIDRRLIKIEMNSIYLIEAKGDYILIKTEEKNYTVHSTMKKVEDKLAPDTFLKVHRSYIINILKIVDIEDNSVLINRDVIPVSRSKKPILMERLNLL
jgi:DNA-binding LytR/AlgR family response regulator